MVTAINRFLCLTPHRRMLAPIIAEKFPLTNSFKEDLPPTLSLDFSSKAAGKLPG